MKNLHIVVLLWASLLLPGFGSVKSFAGTPVKVVVIDAGHGGHDPGAVGGNGTQEKEITLKVALLLGEMIQQKYNDIKVVYTRKTDVFVELNRRTKIANENHADIFISIHCNAAENKSVYGTETFVMSADKANQNIAITQKENASILLESNYEENYNGFDPSSPEAYIIFDLYQNKYLYESSKFAADIQEQFKKLNRHCRGVKQAPFLVLWRTAMPSILSEIGFISNKEEETYLASDKGQQELTKAIFNAFSKLVEEGKNTKTTEIKSIDTTTTKTKTPDVKITETKKTDTKDTIAKTTETKVVEIKNNNTKDTIVKTTAEIPVKDTPDVLYKVQFLYSSKEYSLTDPLFKNMPDISVEKVGNAYKYLSGRYLTFTEVSALLTKIREMGYKDAFIVATQKDGTKISIQEAKELEKK